MLKNVGKWMALAGVLALVVTALGTTSTRAEETTTPLDGANGWQTMRLFGKEDIKREVTDLWPEALPNAGLLSGRYAEDRIAVDGDGNIYLSVWSETDVWYPDPDYAAYIGVVKVSFPDGDPWEVSGSEPVYETLYVRKFDPNKPRQAWSYTSIVLPEFSNALVNPNRDEGAAPDLLLLQDIKPTGSVKNDHRSRVWALNTDASTSPTLRKLFTFKNNENKVPQLLASAGDESGTLYLVHNGLHALTYDEVDEAYELSTILDHDDGTSLAGSMAVGPDGMIYSKLWVHDDPGTSETHKNIYEIDPSDGSTSVFATTREDYPYLRDMAFMPDGKLYVADGHSKKSRTGFIAKRTNKGKFSYKKRIAEFDFPPTGDVYSMHVGKNDALYAIVLEDSTEDPGTYGPTGVYVIWKP